MCFYSLLMLFDFGSIDLPRLMSATMFFWLPADPWQPLSSVLPKLFMAPVQMTILIQTSDTHNSDKWQAQFLYDNRIFYPSKAWFHLFGTGG